jgi:SNF2 family DNA or RNA helicase
MKIGVLPQHRKLVVPYHESIQTLIPGAARLGNTERILVPHEEDSVRVLRNLGIACPAPIQHYYDWAGGKPFEVQKVTADLLTTNQRAYVFNDIGTGKTRSSLYAADYLMKKGLAKRVAVFAPLSTLTMTWDREIFEQFPHLTSVVVYGDRARRVKLLAEPADIYILNHDAVWVLQDELKKRRDIDVLIVDELAVFRNPRSRLHKKLLALIDGRTWVWGMTGAPTPTAPTDAYGQARLITPWRAPRSFKGFRDETMRQVSTFRWVPRKDAEAVVAAMLQPAVRFTRDQCLDLPPVTYSDRAIEMPARAQKAYDRMMKELVAEADGVQIKAVNEGVRIGKLLQIASGFAYDDTGQARYVGGFERVKAIEDVLGEAEGKVIVFAPFTFLARFLCLALQKRGHSTEVIYGDVPKSERDRIFTEFQYGALRCIVAHPQTMAHGLNLTAASVVLWASPTMSLEIYEQANGRITRAGQTRSQHVIHLVGAPMEREVYRRLKGKAKVQGALLELLQQQTGEVK